jgi:large subunit ribosomal protein L9e
MRDVLKTEELDIPEGVEVSIKSRLITVTGPRGTLSKNVRHVNMDIRLLKGKTNRVTLAVWQGGRKHVACLRTIKSLISNMITGVTKVSPVHCVQDNILTIARASNIKCAQCTPTSPSTASSRTTAAKSRSVTSSVKKPYGTSACSAASPLQSPPHKKTSSSSRATTLTWFLSQVCPAISIIIAGILTQATAASIQGSCLVRNKDIRKFLDGIYVSGKGTIIKEE